MTPTLGPGDLVLVRHGARVRPGAVVLGRFLSRPDLAVVKRVARADAAGWWFSSDNERLGTDSAELGVGEVDAVAVCVFRAPRGGATRTLGRFVPRRIGPEPTGL